MVYLIRLRRKSLLIFAAMVELLLGLGIATLPQGHQLLVSAGLNLNWGQLSTSLTMAGVIALVLVRYPMYRWLYAVLLVLAVSPLAFMSLLFAAAGLLTPFETWWLLAGFFGLFSAGTVMMTIRQLPYHTATPIQLPSSPEDSVLQGERLLEMWSWIVQLVILLVALIGGRGNIASPPIISLSILFISSYNIIAHVLLKGVGRSDQRVLSHLVFLTLGISFLLTGGGQWALMISAFMVIPPSVATRLRGARTGYVVLTLIAGMVVLFRSLHGLLTGHPLGSELHGALMQILVISTASILGIRSAAEQHDLVRQLANARSHLQLQLQQHSLVARLGQVIRSSLDLDEILNTTVQELGRTLEVSRCSIRLRGREGFLPVIHLYVAPGVFPLTEDHLPNLHLSHEVEETGKMVVIEDILTHPGWRDKPLPGGIRAALAAPVWAADELVGVITFHQVYEPRIWKLEEIQFLEAVAGQVGLALAHAKTHGELELQHEELKLAHHHLKAQGSELEAQREELKAQNEELIQQGSLLTSQARRLEDALRAARTAEEAQARLIAIVEATTDFIGMTDRSGRIIHLNHAARQELGLTSDGDIQINVHQVFSQSFAQGRLRTALMTAIRRGTWSGEGVVNGSQGREIPVSLVILVHRDQMGEMFFAAIARDISSQRQAQAALQDSEARFRSAFDFAPIGMGLVTLTGRWIQVNRPLCDMLGFTEDELMQTRVDRLIHPDDLEVAMTFTARVDRRELRSYQVEQRWFHKLGHLVWTQVSVSTVRTSEEKGLYYVLHVHDITERKRVENQLIHLANFDPLTDLFNRRRFQEELERQIADAVRYGNPGALLFLDLDQFKYINDSLGHQAGDRMLKSLATLLRGQLRESDAIARLGGDEFAILLPHADRGQAEAVAHKLLDVLRRHVEIIDDRTVGITGSMGIALFPEHGKTAEELLAYADMAMYRVKEVGRNNFTLYTPSETMRLQWESKLTWERRILDALEQNGFMLYEQPILSLATGKVSRYEALLRMKGQNGEVISPGNFLPIAERFGLIHAIDRWVVKESIHQIARRQSTQPGYCLEVNLSGKAFGDPELLPLIKREIETTGINPSLLVLEITETAATDTALGRNFVSTLREMGCRFALDDFGSGFSSFSYLKHLPVDYLKIDGSFIRNLARDNVDQELVRAMVQVARGLGRKTIAEWVEDEETLTLLKEFGVDYAQGYHVGRPLPIEKPTLSS